MSDENAPWLKNQGWARREIVCGPPLGIGILVIAWLVFGGIGLGVLVATLSGLRTSPADKSFGGLLIVAGMVGILAVITYMWLRYRRYGNSVCRLLTLPGVLGGWLKADVECRLPPDHERPVHICLRNVRPSRGGAVTLWSMEKALDSAPISIAGSDRSLVRVRLFIPRESGGQQEPLPMKPSAMSSVRWFLEIRKSARGIDFLARFLVPVYDTPNAPAAEQRPE